MDVLCNFCLWFACERLEPHSRHVKSSHGSAKENTSSREEEPGVFERNTPCICNDALLRPKSSNQWQSHNGRRSLQHRCCSNRHLRCKASHVRHRLCVEVVVMGIVVIVAVVIVMMSVMVSMMHLVYDRTTCHEEHSFCHCVIEKVEQCSSKSHDCIFFFPRCVCKP